MHLLSGHSILAENWLTILGWVDPESKLPGGWWRSWAKVGLVFLLLLGVGCILALLSCLWEYVLCPLVHTLADSVRFGTPIPAIQQAIIAIGSASIIERVYGTAFAHPPASGVPPHARRRGWAILPSWGDRTGASILGIRAREHQGFLLTAECEAAGPCQKAPFTSPRGLPAGS